MKNFQYYNEQRFSCFRDLVDHAVANYPAKSAFRIKRGNETVDITYDEFGSRYYALCTYFLAEGLRGKRIAVMGKNCFEWVLAYLAASTVGVVVPLDKELHGDDVRDFVAAAECSAICIADTLCEKILPSLGEDLKVLPFSELWALSDDDKPHAPVAVGELTFPKDEMQVLIFTSGTTGSAKGVCLSQYNICSNIHSTLQTVKVKTDDTVLSILPLHHTYECTLDCLLILSKGACITYCDGVTKLQKNLSEYRPTVLVGVPILLKMLCKRIRHTLASQAPKKYRELFELYSLADALKKIPLPIRLIITSKVRKSLGGRMRLFIVGAAPLDTTLVADFAALGIRTLQGYGLTETAPLLAGNSDFYLNPESTGKAIPGVTLKIADPNAEGVGEILAKGDNIMLGYYRDEEATRAVLDEEGWFHTGDLGCFNEEGDLFIRGRQKNVIVTENGKNIYPEELETRLAEYPDVSEVLVVTGKEHGETCVKAKIFPNLDLIREKLGEMPTAEQIAAHVKKIVKDVNSRIPAYKQIRIVEVMKEALEKTTTQKIKRYGKNVE